MASEPKDKRINLCFTASEWAEVEALANSLALTDAQTVKSSVLLRARGAKKASAPAAPAWEMT